MKKYFFAFITLTILSKIGAQDRNTILNSLIANEFTFAKSAAEVGTRDAFLQFIADDGIIFRPNPINGKTFLSQSPKRPGLLSWYPSYAEISANGDFGFTTGPADFRKEKDSAAIWFGNFCTVWQRQSNGEWKFLIDIGNSNKKPEIQTEPLKYSEPAKHELKPQISYEPTLLDPLFEANKSLNNILLKEGAIEGYKRFVSDKSRILVDNKFPIIGVDQIAEFISTEIKKYSFVPVGGKLSSSSDLGFTYGNLELKDTHNNKNEIFNYVHVWKKENNAWIILAEIRNTK